MSARGILGDAAAGQVLQGALGLRRDLRAFVRVDGAPVRSGSETTLLGGLALFDDDLDLPGGGDETVGPQKF